MPKISHWLSPSAIASFALTALVSAYAASRLGPAGWMLWFAVLAPLVVWFVAARQAQTAAEARNNAADARNKAAEAQKIANETLGIVKHLADLAGVNANQPPEILAEAIADQDIANRNAVINQLTQVYVLMHGDVSQGIIEGSEPPPLEWLNKGTREIGHELARADHKRRRARELHALAKCSHRVSTFGEIEPPSVCSRERLFGG